jgi:hypothetical protein
VRHSPVVSSCSGLRKVFAVSRSSAILRGLSSSEIILFERARVKSGETPVLQLNLVHMMCSDWAEDLPNPHYSIGLLYDYIKSEIRGLETFPAGHASHAGSLDEETAGMTCMNLS